MFLVALLLLACLKGCKTRHVPGDGDERWHTIC
jgi:hypothetical protein